MNRSSYTCPRCQPRHGRVRQRFGRGRGDAQEQLRLGDLQLDQQRRPGVVAHDVDAGVERTSAVRPAPPSPARPRPARRRPAARRSAGSRPARAPGCAARRASAGRPRAATSARRSPPRRRGTAAPSPCRRRGGGRAAACPSALSPRAAHRVRARRRDGGLQPATSVPTALGQRRRAIVTPSAPPAGRPRRGRAGTSCRCSTSTDPRGVRQPRHGLPPRRTNSACRST